MGAGSSTPTFSDSHELPPQKQKKTFIKKTDFGRFIDRDSILQKLKFYAELNDSKRKYLQTVIDYHFQEYIPDTTIHHIKKSDFKIRKGVVNDKAVKVVPTRINLFWDAVILFYLTESKNLYFMVSLRNEGRLSNQSFLFIPNFDERKSPEDLDPSTILFMWEISRLLSIPYCVEVNRDHPNSKPVKETREEKSKRVIQVYDYIFREVEKDYWRYVEHITKDDEDEKLVKKEREWLADKTKTTKRNWDLNEAREKLERVVIPRVINKERKIKDTISVDFVFDVSNYNPMGAFILSMYFREWMFNHTVSGSALNEKGLPKTAAARARISLFRGIKIHLAHKRNWDEISTLLHDEYSAVLTSLPGDNGHNGFMNKVSEVLDEDEEEEEDLGVSFKPQDDNNILLHTESIFNPLHDDDGSTIPSPEKDIPVTMPPVERKLEKANLKVNSEFLGPLGILDIDKKFHDLNEPLIKHRFHSRGIRTFLIILVSSDEENKRLHEFFRSLSGENKSPLLSPLRNFWLDPHLFTLVYYTVNESTGIKIFSSQSLEDTVIKTVVKNSSDYCLRADTKRALYNDSEIMVYNEMREVLEHTSTLLTYMRTKIEQRSYQPLEPFQITSIIKFILTDHENEMHKDASLGLIATLGIDNASFYIDKIRQGLEKLISSCEKHKMTVIPIRPGKSSTDPQKYLDEITKLLEVISIVMDPGKSSIVYGITNAIVYEVDTNNKRTSSYAQSRIQVAFNPPTPEYDPDLVEKYFSKITRMVGDIVHKEAPLRRYSMLPVNTSENQIKLQKVNEEEKDLIEGNSLDYWDLLTNRDRKSVMPYWFDFDI